MFLSVSDGVGSPGMDDCEPWEPNLNSLEEKCAINCQAPYFKLYICVRICMWYVLVRACACGWRLESWDSLQLGLQVFVNH